MRIRAILTFALTLALLAACQPSRPPLPQGEQERSGVLKQAPLSVHRRGTHVLMVDGSQEAYVESKVVNLRALEGKKVTLYGVFERNTDPQALPVLVVSSATSSFVVATEQALPRLGIALTLPQGWSLTEEKSGIRISLSGSLMPLVLVTSGKAQSLPATKPTMVGGRPALIATDLATGEQTVMLRRDSGSVVLRFIPSPGELDLAGRKEQFNRLLSSIRFLSSSRGSTTSAAGTKTGTGSLMVCGGPAGILCPQGSYCSIDDSALGIGHCVVLRR